MYHCTGTVNLNVGQPFQKKKNKQNETPSTFHPGDGIYHVFSISSSHEKMKDTLIFSRSDAKGSFQTARRSDVKGPPLGLACQREGGQTCRHDGGGFCALS